MGDIPLEFIGEHVLRLVDGQRKIERTLDDMLGRLQSLESNVVDIKRDIVRIDIASTASTNASPAPNDTSNSSAPDRQCRQPLL